MDIEQKGRLFTQEEVSAILSRAVERRNPGGGGLTYAELIDTARQAGIDPGAIDAAVQDLQADRRTAVADDAVKLEIARRRWHSWRRFALHFTVFVMFNVFLAAINLHEGGEIFFFIPLLLWGIGIAAHFVAILYPAVLPNPDRIEEVRRELEKRDRRGGRKKEKDRPGVRVEASSRVRIGDDDEALDEARADDEKRARNTL